MRVGAPCSECHPRSLHLGRIRRCRSSRRHRLSTGGFHTASSTKACRLRFGCRHRQVTTATSSISRTGSRSTPALCATSTRVRQQVVTPSVGHTGRFPGRRPTFPVTPFTGGQPMTSPIDYNQHLLAYLQAWRQLLEASAAMASGHPAAYPARPQRACRPSRRCHSCRRWRHPAQVRPGRARRPTTRSSCSATFRRGGSTSSRRSARRRAQLAADTRAADWRTDDNHGADWFPSTGSQSTGSTGSQSTASQSSFGAIKASACGQATQKPVGRNASSTVTSGADSMRCSLLDPKGASGAPILDPVRHSPRRWLPLTRGHRCKPGRNRSSSVALRTHRR